MTELEIVDFLKDNKKLGICFLYMPEEVRNWCEKHMKDVVKLVSDFPAKNTSPFKHKWQYVAASYEKFKYNDIIALKEEYELKSENKTGELVEFEIDEEGCFHYNGWSFKWYDTTGFLNFTFEKYCTVKDICDKFISFGGYFYGNQHEPVPRWYMCHCVAPTDVDGSVYTSYTDGDENIKGIVPTKIRFWKEFNK